MKIGDYVRTKKGEIGKIIGYIDEPTDYFFNCYVTTLKTNFIDTYITEYNNIKSSSNIIDLIEIGDYVNGCIVINKNDDAIQVIQLIIPFDLKEKDIKSIVTKEQFKSMEYKIGE